MFSKLKKISLIIPMLIMFTLPAFGTAVTTFTATDATSAVPTSKGTYLLDFRFSGEFPKSSFILPTFNFIAGVWDNIELGIGSGLNFSSFATSNNKFSLEYTNVWARIGLPISTEYIKTAIIFGGLIPVYNSSTALQSGIEASIDFITNPITTNVNFGYSKNFNFGNSAQSNDNILSGNLNFTLPFSNFTFFEEQFINYPVGNFANGGFRVSVFSPPIFDNKLTFDINTALLFSNDIKNCNWSFSPNIGLVYKF